MIHKLALLLALAATSTFAQTAKDIDPMLGVAAGGNTFPGPSLPWGMVKPGPDYGDNLANAGWRPEGEINGFSQVHVSGTGGAAKYGNLLVQPTTGEPAATGFSSPRANEKASVGFYSVTLTRFPVEVAMTAARRTALYRFAYPAGVQKNILFDMNHVLSPTHHNGEAQMVVKTSVHIVSSTEVAGQQWVMGGWNKQITPYVVYFYAVTDAPAASWGTWHETTIEPGSRQFVGGINQGAGAYLSIAAGSAANVQMKIGISFISEAQAKSNAMTEINGFDFEGTRTAALTAWDNALSRVKIEGASDEDRGTFASAIYHTMLMPVDRTGENPLWKSEEPYYDDYYAIWDTFRTSSPLLDLIAPEREDGIVRSLVDIYRHEGWYPDARSGNVTGRTQGGSNTDFVIADAWIKKLPKIDWAMAYAGLVKDAEVAPEDQNQEGRGGLEDWKTLGYPSIESVDRTGSKAMEYAGNDAAIAVVAKGLRHDAEAAKYRKRSQNWENLWDKDATDGGFSGFIWSRHRDGSWKTPFNAHQSGSWGSDTFYEGNTWTYSTFVPQDVARLIVLCGGDETFVKRIDAFFAVPGRFDVNNEPGFLSPYLYNWAGRQDRTAFQVRAILAKSFHSGPKGLPGNDDSGAMSSWYAFGKLGFFPNAGSDVYLIGSPAYPAAEIHLENGKVFRVEAKGVSAENQYVAAATWNGRPWTRNWFTHEDLMRGGTLVLTMSAAPVKWDTGAVPPSASKP